MHLCCNALPFITFVLFIGSNYMAQIMEKKLVFTFNDKNYVIGIYYLIIF